MKLKSMIRQKNKGFALMSAIFLMVVLGMLGSYMVTISGTQHQTINYSLLNAGAYQAASSGLEWGAYRVLADSSCVSFPKTIDYSVDGLIGFKTIVSCSMTVHQEKSNSFNVFDLRSISSTDFNSFGSLNYISREVAVTVTDVIP